MDKAKAKRLTWLAVVTAVAWLAMVPASWAEIEFNRKADFAAGDKAVDPNNAHGTVWEPSSLTWSYYYLKVQPDDPTVYPGTEYEPEELIPLPYWTDTESYYDPCGTPTSHIVFEYETIGAAANLEVFWNAINSQTGGVSDPFDPDAPYGKQQWIVAVFTNPFDMPITVDLAGEHELQAKWAGRMDGTKMEIAKIDAAFENKTVLWSYVDPAGGGTVSSYPDPWVTYYLPPELSTLPALQDIALGVGESIAFGLRATNLEEGVNGITGQFVKARWVDEMVTVTVAAATPLTLTVDANPAAAAGSVSGGGTYNLGDVVQVSAVDYPDCANNVVYQFDHWTGDVADTQAATTTVLMDASQTVTAVYVPTAECGDVCHPQPDADLTGDCIVNMDDLTDLVAEWLTSSL